MHDYELVFLSTYLDCRMRDDWKNLSVQRGYASIKTVYMEDGENALKMAPPNQEVRTFLAEAALTYLTDQAGSNLIDSYKSSLLDLNFTKMECYLSEITKLVLADKKDVCPSTTYVHGCGLHILLNDDRFHRVSTCADELEEVRIRRQEIRAWKNEQDQYDYHPMTVFGEVSQLVNRMIAFNNDRGELQLMLFEMERGRSASVLLEELKQFEKSIKRAVSYFLSKHQRSSEDDQHHHHDSKNVKVQLVGINIKEDFTVEVKHEEWICALETKPNK